MHQPGWIGALEVSPLNNDTDNCTTRRPTTRCTRTAQALLIGLGVALAFTACSSKGAARDQSNSLVVASPQEPPDWDYVRNPSTAIRQVLVLNVLEPLLEKQEDGSFKPLVAESYKASKDGLTYTFTIREATFHDGSELSADDVAYSLNYNKSSTDGDVSAPFKAVKAIKKVDDRTVKVTLKKPSQKFLEGMSSHSALVIPEGGKGKLKKQPVGTGPFVFDKWRSGVQVGLKRHEDYWGDKPSFEHITWRFIGEETASVNSLLARDIDLITPIVGDGMERVKSVDQTAGFAAHLAAGAEITYLSLNAKEKVFDDKRVREAIAHAVDRQTLIDGALAGLAKPTCVFVNPATEQWNSDACAYSHDPARARELLAEAGANDVKLRFVYLKSNYFPPSMEILTQQLKDVGISVESQGLDLATYLDQIVGKADYELTHITGPQKIDSWTCPGWFTGDCVKNFDGLLREADASVERSGWADLRRQAVEMHAERAYLIPLANVDLITLHRDDLTGLKSFTSSSEVDLRSLRWKE